MQQVLTGEHILEQLPSLLRTHGEGPVFLLSGTHLLGNMPTVLSECKIAYHWIKRGPNVEQAEISEVADCFENNPTTTLVAIGGGSVIDLAKSVIHAREKKGGSIPFFVAIPTTAGSGSEATHFAVVYQGKKKQSLAGNNLLPSLVLLDPVLTYSLSSYQTAVSGIDALAQAIESYWNKHATEESKMYATQAIRLCKAHFIGAVHGQDVASRHAMQQAAHLSGKAINITRTTGPHALSYYLTAHHAIAHGQAVALLLPLFFLYNQPAKELLSLFDATGERQAMVWVQQFMQQAGLATTFAALHIDKEGIIEALLDEVNQERFANNPVSFDRERLKQLMEEYL